MVQKLKDKFSGSKVLPAPHLKRSLLTYGHTRNRSSVLPYRAAALGGRYRHHGRLPHRLVIVGRQPPAHGGGHPGLETDPHPPGQHLLLPAHRRLDRADAVREYGLSPHQSADLIPPAGSPSAPGSVPPGAQTGKQGRRGIRQNPYRIRFFQGFPRREHCWGGV